MGEVGCRLKAIKPEGKKRGENDVNKHVRELGNKGEEVQHERKAPNERTIHQSRGTKKLANAQPRFS
jgi:hypothetical protein